MSCLPLALKNIMISNDILITINHGKHVKCIDIIRDKKINKFNMKDSICGRFTNVSPDGKLLVTMLQGEPFPKQLVVIVSIDTGDIICEIPCGEYPWEDHA